MNTSQKEKQSRPLASLHMTFARLRENKVPGIIAEIAAICLSIPMAISRVMLFGSKQYWLVVIPVFLITSIIFQMMSRATFGLIYLFTIPAYRLYVKNNDAYDYDADMSQEDFYEYDVDPEPNSDGFYMAKATFSVGDIFTREQLKKIYTYKLQHEPIHPDNGGTSQRFVEFNEAYNLLKKHAVDHF